MAGCPVEQTATEYDVLFELGSTPGRVLTQDQLQGSVLDTNRPGDLRPHRTHLRRLRRKHGDDTSPRLLPCRDQSLLLDSEGGGARTRDGGIEVDEGAGQRCPSLLCSTPSRHNRWRRASVGSPTAQPHLEDGSVYHQNRPTRLDKIKNLRIKVQVSSVGVALTGLAAHPCGAPMRRAAGQSSQRGFYSEDLKSAMRLPAMS